MWQYERPYAYMEHHGILGQKWGIRRYQNKDGTLTPEGRARLDKYKQKLTKQIGKRYDKITEGYQKRYHKTQSDNDKRTFENLDSKRKELLKKVSKMNYSDIATAQNIKRGRAFCKVVSASMGLAPLIAYNTYDTYNLIYGQRY